MMTVTAMTEQQFFSGLNWIPLHFSEFWRWSGFVLSTFIPLPSSNVETGI